MRRMGTWSFWPLACSVVLSGKDNTEWNRELTIPRMRAPAGAPATGCHFCHCFKIGWALQLKLLGAWGEIQRPLEEVSL